MRITFESLSPERGEGASEGEKVRLRGNFRGNDTRRDVYRPSEAKDAWTRVLKFFATHLKG